MGSTKAKLGWLLVVLVCAVPRLLAEAPAFVNIRIPRVSSPPRLEDFLGMEPSPAWKNKLAKVDHFTQRIPSDGAPVSQRTEAYLGYDDKNLYAIFICFDSEREKLRGAKTSSTTTLSKSSSTPFMTTVTPMPSM